MPLPQPAIAASATKTALRKPVFLPQMLCLIEAHTSYGAMFWFTWNTLSGSNRRFSSTSRA